MEDIPKMLTSLIALLNSFSKWTHDIGTIVFLPLMILLVAINVIFRYFFNYPLSWGEEMDGLLLFLVLFCSMTYTWDQKRHIRIELVYEHLKGRFRTIADIASGLTGIIFFGLIGYQSFKEIPYMIKTHETGEALEIPFWPFWIVMGFIGFVFALKLAIYILYQRKELERKTTD
jgi:TRAP-type C4-dicarboxylate transport system permease small subunit